MPKPSGIENDLFSWEGVKGAVTYDVRVDDDEEYYTVETTSCDLTLLIHDYDEHEISVRANTHDGTSDFSYAIPYQRKADAPTLSKLAAPSGLNITGYRLLWNGVNNNNGYEIFFDGDTISADKNTNYLDLDLKGKADGKYKIRMRTIGDGLSYKSSDYGTVLEVDIANGMARLLPLDTPVPVFNAETKEIEWDNRYGSNFASYVVCDDSGKELTSFSANANSKKMSYRPVFTDGTAIGYTVYTKSEIEIYKDSSASTTVQFPLTDVVPRELALQADEETQKYYFTWSERAYSAGYYYDVDGASGGNVQTNRVYLPTGLEEGKHLFRVRTVGDNHYYAPSVFSAEAVFYVNAEGLCTLSLATPAPPSATFSGGKIEVNITEVEKADRYRVFIRSGEEIVSFDIAGTSFALTATTLNGEALTAEGKAAAAKAIAFISEGAAISIEALSDSVLYATSPRSKEILLSANEEIVFLAAPVGLEYDKSGLSFERIEEITDYEIELDGEHFAFVTSSGFGGSISSGWHRARVRAKGESALWSAEIEFLSPVTLAAPADLKVTSGVLSFVRSDNAVGYRLYANGKEITTISMNETRVTLSNYPEIASDGIYVLSLSAIGGVGYGESPMSEQYRYVKTDGVYGTASKPHQPTTAAELLSVIKGHPSDYITLSYQGEYDFSTCKNEEYCSDYKGLLNGNGATLKGIKADTSFFSALENATLTDLTFEIDASSFLFSQSGVLANQLKKSVLKNVTVVLSGQAEVRSGASFGMIAYQVTDAKLENFRLNYDALTLVGTGDMNVGGIAYAFDGTIRSSALDGALLISGVRLSYSGLGSTGKITATDLAMTPTLTLTGTGYVQMGGLSTSAEITASGLTLLGKEVFNAPIVNYYGVGGVTLSLTDSTLGDSVSVTATDNVKMYGVSGGKLLSVSHVTVSSTLGASSSGGTILATGFGDSIPADCAASGAVFEGQIELSGDTEKEVKAAGFASSILGDHTLTSVGSITLLTKGSAKVAGIAFSANKLTAHLSEDKKNASVTVKNASLAEISGGAETGNTLLLSGKLIVAVSDCDDLHFGGALMKGSSDLSLCDYTLQGKISMKKGEIGGIIYLAEDLVISELNMTVDLEVENTSDTAPLEVTGGVYSCQSLTLPETKTFTLKKLSATSSYDDSRVAGFLLNGNTINLANLSIDGTIILKGAGTASGIADEARDLTGVTSSVSLIGEGAVSLCGLARSVSSAEDIMQTNCTVTVKSDAGEYSGLIGTLPSSGDVTRAEISGVTFKADPVGKGNTSFRLYGITKGARSISGAEIEDVTFTIGTFKSFTFAALSEKVTARIESSTLSYELTSNASTNEIGGAVYTLAGDISSLFLGNETAPLAFHFFGQTCFGGLAVTGDDVTSLGGSAVLQVDLHLPSAGESTVGGLLAGIPSGKSVLSSGYEVDFTLTKEGSGRAVIGGAVGMHRGSFSGACVTNHLTDLSSDVVGGVIGKMESATLRNSYALGSVTANGEVGGVIGEIKGGYAGTSFSAMEITVASGMAGGIFAKGESKAELRNLYSLSRFPNRGSGLFGTANDLTLQSIYFAGSAKQYAIASSLIGCRTSNIFIDASLSDLTVGGGVLSSDYEYRSFSYGYAGSDFDSQWTVRSDRYPYLTALGYVLPDVTVRKYIDPREITLSIGDNLYEKTGYRTLDKVAPSITWVDNSGNLKIESGVVTDVLRNGEGTLYGRISKGGIAYEISYTAFGHKPKGSGVAVEPYLITAISEFSYISEEPNAYYLVDLAEALPEQSAFETLCNAIPFGGTLDFNGATLVHPQIGSEGLFGSIAGGTVKNLTITGGNLSGSLITADARDATITGITFKGSVSGVSDLVDSAVNTTFEDICFVLQGKGDFALVNRMQGGALRAASLSFLAKNGGTSKAFLIKEGDGVTVCEAQALLRAESAECVKFSLTETDNASQYEKAMLIVDIQDGQTEGVTAGFAFTGEETELTDAACLLYTRNVTCYPLMKSETDVVYTGVKVLADHGEIPKAREEMALAPESALTILASMPGFEAQEGQIPTPCGYDLFEEITKDQTSIHLKVTDSEGEKVLLEDETDLYDLLDISGEKSMTRFLCPPVVTSGSSVSVRTVDPSDETMVSFDKSYKIRPIGEGESVLTLTDLFGTHYTVTILVEEYHAFASGSGTESDPYVISSFEEFRMLSYYADEYSYYVLDDNLEGEIDEPVRFNGVLTGSGSVTVTLTSGPLFTSLSGRIAGRDEEHPLTFCLESSISEITEEDGALFSSGSSDVTMEYCDITVTASPFSVQSETFGVIFARLGSGRLSDVTIDVGETEASATACTFGIIAGVANNSFFENVTLTGSLTMHGTGNITLGAIGYLTASEPKEVTEEEDESETVRYYVNGLTLDLALDVTGDALIVGGAAGRSEVDMILDGTGGLCLSEVQMTLSGGRIVAGGAVGKLHKGSILGATMTADIATSACAGGCFGGIAGEMDFDTPSLCDVILTASIDVTAEGDIFAGGILGYGTCGKIDHAVVTATVSATSQPSEDAIAELTTRIGEYLPIVAAGGAVGYLDGSAQRVSVTLSNVFATADYEGSDLVVLAGGLAAYLYNAEDVVVKGTGEVAASGGASITAGLTALLWESVERAVVSGVTLSGDLIGGVVGVYPFRETNGIIAAFSFLTSDTTGAIVGALASDEGAIRSCGYTSGVALGGTIPDGYTIDAEQGVESDFYQKGRYVALGFDEEIWLFTGENLPTLK